MIKKNKKNKTILIACYRKPYSESNLKIIENILKEQKPEKVKILSISEIRKTQRNIKTYFGTKDIEKFEQKILDDQTIRLEKYSQQIMQICKKLNLNCNIEEKKGIASKIIKKQIKKQKPVLLIIHKSDKNKLDRSFNESVEEELCRKKVCKIKILS